MKKYIEITYFVIIKQFCCVSAVCTFPEDDDTFTYTLADTKAKPEDGKVAQGKHIIEVITLHQGKFLTISFCIAFINLNSNLCHCMDTCCIFMKSMVIGPRYELP